MFLTKFTVRYLNLKETIGFIQEHAHAMIPNYRTIACFPCWCLYVFVRGNNELRLIDRRTLAPIDCDRIVRSLCSLDVQSIPNRLSIFIHQPPSFHIEVDQNSRPLHLDAGNVVNKTGFAGMFTWNGAGHSGAKA